MSRDLSLAPCGLVTPSLPDQNLCAQSLMPMDMTRHGSASSLFHASQQWSTRSSSLRKMRLDSQLYQSLVAGAKPRACGDFLVPTTRGILIQPGCGFPD